MSHVSWEQLHMIFDESIFDPKAEYFRYSENMTESSHWDEADSSFKDFGAELSAASCMDRSKEQPDVWVGAWAWQDLSSLRSKKMLAIQFHKFGCVNFSRCNVSHAIFGNLSR